MSFVFDHNLILVRQEHVRSWAVRQMLTLRGAGQAFLWTDVLVVCSATFLNLWGEPFVGVVGIIGGSIFGFVWSPFWILY